MILWKEQTVVRIGNNFELFYNSVVGGGGDDEDDEGSEEGGGGPIGFVGDVLGKESRLFLKLYSNYEIC